MNQPAANPSDLPVILGGLPVIPEGPPDWPLNDPEIGAALERAFADGSWGKYHGGHCEHLIERLAEYHSCEHVVLCSSGTAAVELALRGLTVGEGDEVVLAAYDFKGNFQDVLAVGAKPVLVDVLSENWNLNPALLEAAITPATKAIIVSHLHGGVVEMPLVMEIARRHDVAVIEDACQMPGAQLFTKKAGLTGDVGVLSFGGSKLLSAGRGGALLTDNAEIVQRARLYSHRGNESYPLSELQAAVLIPQLDRLDELNARRVLNVTRLCEGLTQQPGLTPFSNRLSDIQPAYYKLGFQYADEHFDGLLREAFVEAIRAEGVALDTGFRALHRVHSGRRYRLAGPLPQADEADLGVLTLHHPVLLEEGEIMDRIVEAVDKVRRYAGVIRQRTL